MKNLVFILSLIMFSSVSFAQDFDLASEITSTASDYNEKEENKNKDTNDKDNFSFLDFSFIKKHFLSSSDNNETPEIINTTKEISEDNNKKETPLEKAIRQAEAGNVDAQLNLGYMYLYGQDGVPSDYAKAFHFYELAAKQNNPIALNNLGSLYFNGIGTQVNYQIAAELFYKAAQNGSDDAAVNLAFIFLSSENTDNQHENAIKLFRKAAESGNNTAKFMLGYAYYKGYIVEQDFHKAILLIREAANAKFDVAQYMLGIMYKEGQGVAKNYGNAVKNFRYAVDQGNVPAMMELAEVYAQGSIYPKNDFSAHVLFNVASVYDVPHAAIRRDEIEPSLKIEDLLNAQQSAENYKEKPSELTSYIRQTYGKDVRSYIDENLIKQKKVANDKNSQ